MQRVRGQRFPGIVTAAKAASPRRHEGQSAVGQRAGIEVVFGAVGQLPQLAAIGRQGVEVETAALRRVEIRFLLGGPLGKGEIDPAGVVVECQGGIVAAWQAAGDQVAHRGRPARFVQHEHAPARHVAIIVVVAQILVQHLRDEPAPLHEHQRLAGQQRVLQGQLPRGPPQLVVQRLRPFGRQRFGPLDLVLQAAQFGGFRLQRRRRQGSAKVRQQPLPALPGLADRARRVGRLPAPPLLGSPIRLDLFGPRVAVSRAAVRRGGLVVRLGDCCAAHQRRLGGKRQRCQQHRKADSAARSIPRRFACRTGGRGGSPGCGNHVTTPSRHAGRSGRVRSGGARPPSSPAILRRGDDPVRRTAHAAATRIRAARRRRRGKRFRRA